MKRPFAVTILGCVFIIAGLVGLIYHLSERPLERWIVPVSIVRVIAVVGGSFLLRGQNWARWLLLAWLVFHVVVSAFHSLSEFIPHVVLLLIFGYVLLGPPTSNISSPRHPRELITGSPKKAGATLLFQISTIASENH